MKLNLKIGSQNIKCNISKLPAGNYILDFKNKNVSANSTFTKLPE
jgi:hypothetical protein